MMSISKVYDFDFQRMVRTRGGMIGNQNRGHGRGRARGRGRGLGVQSKDVMLIEKADVPVRSQLLGNLLPRRLQLAMREMIRRMSM